MPRRDGMTTPGGIGPRGRRDPPGGRRRLLTRCGVTAESQQPRRSDDNRPGTVARVAPALPRYGHMVPYSAGAHPGRQTLPALATRCGSDAITLRPRFVYW